MNNLLFIANVILEITSSKPEIIRYRFDVARKVGYFNYLRQRKECFNRKRIIKKLTFGIQRISLTKIYLGHDVLISDHLIGRVSNLRNKIGYLKGLSIHDASEVVPSDEPIKLLKKDDKYIVVSGNGRITAACMADLEYVEALVFEDNEKQSPQ